MYRENGLTSLNKRLVTCAVSGYYKTLTCIYRRAVIELLRCFNLISCFSLFRRGQERNKTSTRELWFKCGCWKGHTNFVLPECPARCKHLAQCCQTLKENAANWQKTRRSVFLLTLAHSQPGYREITKNLNSNINDTREWLVTPLSVGYLYGFVFRSFKVMPSIQRTSKCPVGVVLKSSPRCLRALVLSSLKAH